MSKDLNMELYKELFSSYKSHKAREKNKAQKLLESEEIVLFIRDLSHSGLGNSFIASQLNHEFGSEFGTRKFITSKSYYTKRKKPLKIPEDAEEIIVDGIKKISIEIPVRIMKEDIAKVVKLIKLVYKGEC